MTRDGRSSAVAATAASAGEGANQGCLAAHTGAGGETEAQGDLLRVGEAFEAELALFEDTSIAPPKRGRGRPPGSPNRTTTMLKQLLLARGYRDPAEFLAAVMTEDVKVLAETLKCDRLEAAKLQRQAATDLMPYFHQRMPQEVEPRPPEARPLVMIVESGARVGVAKDDGTFSVLDVEPNQRLSEPAPRTSHDDTSHGEG